MAAMNVGQTNPELASMRMYTGIKEIANSLSGSTNPAVTSGGLHLDISALPSTPGATIYTQTDRFVDVATKATETISKPGYAVGLGFDNTFAQREKNPNQRPGQKKRKP